MLEDLPKPIKDHIIKSSSFDDYVNKPNTYSLTELLYCIRKAYFKRIIPKQMTLEQAFNLYRGKVFDNLWTPLFRHNQVRSTYRCKSIPITISGKYDFIDENGVLVDLKTAKSLYYINEPGYEYIQQVRFYAWLNSIEKAKIVYIDFGDAKVFDVEVGNCEQLLEELETKASQLYYALKNCKAPEKTTFISQAWLCQKCDYKTECDNCA
jgi:CRISPR-associated exonuclease Cas4